MANNQKNVQPKVVTTTTTTTSRRRGRRRRRTPRTATSSKTTVRKISVLGQSRRPPRRRFNRPGNLAQSGGTTFRQKITATLGTIGSNQGNAIELEASVLLNPALMKETTGSNAFGPLQMYAANYSLWRARDIIVKLTPLVGGSAVSGTAIRTSLNLSAQPGSPSWSALGARRHRDTNPGRPMTMRIPGSAILGPKEGWFLCNTKNDPMMCIAGSIEIHTLGKTLSTYKNEDFTGPLFLAELTAIWEFKNYNPEPGMLNLVKTNIQEEPQTVKINAKPGEPITISVPNSSSMARAVAQVDSAASTTPSEIIWQICDSAVTIIDGILPPPFEWLFKAGWWFVKKIANKKTSGNAPGEPAPGELTFQVYQSISDAQNDVPCLATGNAASTNVKINNWEMMQITPGNLGNQQVSVATMGRSIEPTTNPITVTASSLLGQAPLYASLHRGTPLNAIAIEGPGQHKRKIHTFSIHALNNPQFYQDGYSIDPALLQVNSYPILNKIGDTYKQIGMIYAANHVQAGRQPLHWTTCLWQATTSTSVRIQSTSNRDDQYLFVRPDIGTQPQRLPSFTQKIQATNLVSTAQADFEIIAGNWYISVFASWGGTKYYDVYGVDFWYSNQTVDTGATYEIGETFEAYKVGMLLDTAQPLELQLLIAPTALTTREILALRDIMNGQYTSPPLSSPPLEYDKPEVPLLEGDEEQETHGAVGGVKLQRDIKNWVEFGHRKRPPTPFSPVEEEEEEEEESDLDDDDYAEVPSFVKNLLTPEAKKLLDDLKKMGLDHEKATKAAQGAYPHPAIEKWEAAYHNALVDGLSPPSARDCAWGEISDYL
ncbi:capsid protein [Mamastrovirus 4]|uniref:Capsid protein n=1 Tax=Mamastrovirus 4 TaxID=1239568 RepID=A0A7S8FAE8_9VIRU|nr:capsid protein [Mamastrovirus 4]